MVRADAATDPTGVNKALFDLALAVPRHAFAVGVACLAQRLAGQAAPATLATELRRSVRLSDGKWFELLRVLELALHEASADCAAAFGFASSREARELVRARNDFAHRGASGVAAPGVVEAFLRRATAVLELEPPGGWSDRAAPWLSCFDGEWTLPDPPHAEGQLWRVWLPRRGEHRPYPPLDAALRDLSGHGPRPVLPTSRPAMVGREREVAELHELALEAAQGGVRLAVLDGGSGYGRTRLVEELLASSSALLGIERSIASACASHQRGALRSLALALDEAPELNELSLAVAAARSPLVAQDPAALTAALEALEDTLLKSSCSQPLLWVIDDAQWLDERTLELVLMLSDRAGRSTHGHLLVVLTLRGRSSAVWHKLSKHPALSAGRGVRVLGVSLLSPQAAATLALNVAPLSQAVVERVVELAAGVPRFIIQPVLGWHELGHLTWQAGAWHASPDALAELPPAARDTLEARLRAHFDAESRASLAADTALGVAALDAMPSTYARILRATCDAGHDARTAVSALEALLSIGIFTRPAPSLLAFAQPLVYEAARERIEGSPGWAVALRALLAALASEPTAADHGLALAQGYRRLGEPERAAPFAATAFTRAMREGAFQRAHEAALELTACAVGPAPRLRAAICQADALRALGSFGRALDILLCADFSHADARDALRVRILEAVVRDALRDPGGAATSKLVVDADASNDAELRLDARLAVARMIGGDDGLALADEAVTLADGFDLVRRYRARDVRAVVNHCHPQPDLDKLREDVRYAGQLAAAANVDWMTIESAMNLTVLVAEIEPQRALDDFVSLIDRARDKGLRSLTRVLLVNATVLRQRLGDHAGSATSAREACRAAREAGDRGAEGAALGLLADALLSLGTDLEEALQAARASLELKRNDASSSLAWLRCSRGHRALGALDQAVSAAAAAVEAARQRPFQDLAERSALWLAVLNFERGAPDAARELERAVRAVEAMGTSARPPARALALEARKLLATS